VPVATRGEIWTVDFSPTVGHEQAGRRPALVISVDELNQSPAELLGIVSNLTMDDVEDVVRILLGL